MTEDAKVEAWRLLITTHKRLVDKLERDLDNKFGLPISWYDVMLHLYEAPGGHLRMHELADSLLVSRSALTRFVDKVEDAGFVRRLPADEDARGTYLTLTGRGRTAFTEAGRAHRQGIIDYFGDHLSDSEVETLTVALTRVLDAS